MDLEFVWKQRIFEWTSTTDKFTCARCRVEQRRIAVHPQRRWRPVVGDFYVPETFNDGGPEKVLCLCCRLAEPTATCHNCIFYGTYVAGVFVPCVNCQDLLGSEFDGWDESDKMDFCAFKKAFLEHIKRHLFTCSLVLLSR